MGLMSGSYLARVDMTLLIPELIHACVDLFEQLNNRVGITYRAYLGYRPAYPDQQRLYEESLNGGPRAAPPWLSSHQWGLAVDVEAYNPGPTWDDKAYVPLWRAWTTILFYGPVILLATGIILNSVTLMALGTLFALLYCLAFLVLIW